MKPMPADQPRIPSYILPVIVLAQFAGTSLWFAGNAIIPDLVLQMNLTDSAVGHITSAVQFGFITGTLIFAWLSIADRMSPSLVFLICAIAGSATNLLALIIPDYLLLLTSRFATGFFLAGIYPVGMKIASDWHKKGLRKALGFLVGALVLGTALPHLIRDLTGELPWKFILISTSVFASTGGVLLYMTVPDGPFSSRRGIFKPDAITQLFKNKNFRSSSFGYFGHMWELYTFWAFIPVLLIAYQNFHTGTLINVSRFSFLIIAAGAAGCAIGGYFALKYSSKRVAAVSLIVSGVCCLLIPFFFGLNEILFLSLLMVWGFFVVSDSPQFSSLVAASSDSDYVATGLTIVNCIGFAITIVSLQLMNILWQTFQSPYVLMVLAVGPALGLIAILKYRD
jgi:predicted MFS family arabinose efflux permease